MPILNVKISGPRDTALTAQVTELLLEATTRILRKQRQLTAVAIDYVSAEDWTVGGSTLAKQGLRSFYFDIKVVDETNTKAEKAQYIKEVFEGFERLLGKLHPESYIYIQDVRATAYGYGGKTQEHRFQHAA